MKVKRWYFPGLELLLHFRTELFICAVAAPKLVISKYKILMVKGNGTGQGREGFLFSLREE